MRLLIYGVVEHAKPYGWFRRKLSRPRVLMVFEDLDIPIVGRHGMGRVTYEEGRYAVRMGGTHLDVIAAEMEVQTGKRTIATEYGTIRIPSAEDRSLGIPVTYFGEPVDGA